jgi:hypothetical protein
LRARFGNAPILALTATATDRVRTDIVRHLKLRDPATFVVLCVEDPLKCRGVLLPTCAAGRARGYVVVGDVTDPRVRERGDGAYERWKQLSRKCSFTRW